jgi:DNA-binding MarR family transcriptional regulator
MDRFATYVKMMDAFYEGSRIIHAYDKIPRKSGVDQYLYMAEMHTLEKIAETEGITVTKLADLTHKTKSAITQVTNKLQRKKMIDKIRSKEYHKEVELYLTELGREACKYHRAFDENNYKNGIKYLEDYSVEELRTSAEIFTIVTQSFKKDVLDILGIK